MFFFRKRKKKKNKDKNNYQKNRNIVLSAITQVLNGKKSHTIYIKNK